MSDTTASSVATPSAPLAIDSPTERSIDDLPFQGFDNATPDVVRALLRRCGVKTGSDIETLGCTGAMKAGLSLDDIVHLRLGIAGGGIGLPCFVPPSRFCKAHNTIGGLQDGQKAQHEDAIPLVSRELTREERGRVVYVDAIRHNARENVGEQMAAAQLALSGYGEQPRGVELVEDDGVPHPVIDGGVSSYTEPVEWRCSEHTVLSWSCRFCVAQAIVDGELSPEFTLHQPEKEGAPGEATFGLSGPELVDNIVQLDRAGVDKIEIYVLAKTLTRRLA